VVVVSIKYKYKQKKKMDSLLPLDPKIRDWVLFPMVFLSVLMGLGRHYANQLLTTAVPPKLDLDTHRAKQIIQRSTRVRSNCWLLPRPVFEQRKKTFSGKGGLMSKKKAAEVTPANPLQDPSMMNNMMKQQVTMMLPNMGMMAFVSYFFSGFVLCKVPFPLTSGFREMLQRGVTLSTLDVSYVSSLSVYFLVMFGLSGLFGLILGGSGGTHDDFQAQMGMINPMQQQQQQPFDAAKAFETECESLELASHEWKIGRLAEKKFLAKS
jgi:hypothetical protein